jgi:hypothetical protein
MDKQDSMISLLEIRSALGPLYGTEDLCVLLYSLVRMERPQNMVEIGTGTGICAAWMAQAVKENGQGHVHTLDNGADEKIICQKVRKVKNQLPSGLRLINGFTYEDYLAALFLATGVRKHVSFYNASVSLDQSEMLSEIHPFMRTKIDLLLCDFAHGPEAIMDLLSYFLPMMSDCSSIFIDSASTHLPSFLLLERLVSQLNNGKMPHHFLTIGSSQKRWQLFEIVTQRSFRLMHLIERKDRVQNSTAWIKIEPTDWVPHPLSRLH